VPASIAILTNADGHSCIDIAVLARRYETAAAFCAVDAHLVSQREACLFHPIEEGNLAAVQTLLHAMAEVNKLNDHKECILGVAAHFGRSDICLLLLTNERSGLASEQKATNINPALKNDNDNTALHIACQQGYKEVVEAIIQGLSTNGKMLEQCLAHKNFRGFTPLDIVVNTNDDPLQQLLMGAGGRANKVGIQAFFEALEARDVHKAVVMLSSGSVPLSECNKQGWTPLHAATAAGCIIVINMLAEMQANLNCTALFTGETPLHLAVAQGNLEMVKCLTSPFKTKPDPHTKKIVHLDPCNVNAESIERDTPLDKAFAKRDEAVVKFLLECGGTLKRTKAFSLHEACVECSDTWAMLSIEGGSDLHGARLDDQAMNAPIHAAAKGGHGKLCVALLEGGADPMCENRWRQTPLHVATSPCCVDALFQAQTDLNASDHQMRDPLHSACAAGVADVVGRILTISSGNPARMVRANKGDINLDTAAHLAARAGHLQALLQLITHTTIFPLPRNQEGETALDVAKIMGFNDIADTICTALGKHEVLEVDGLLSDFLE